MGQRCSLRRQPVEEKKQPPQLIEKHGRKIAARTTPADSAIQKVRWGFRLAMLYQNIGGSAKYVFHIT